MGIMVVMMAGTTTTIAPVMTHHHDSMEEGKAVTTSGKSHSSSGSGSGSDGHRVSSTVSTDLSTTVRSTSSSTRSTRGGSVSTIRKGKRVFNDNIRVAARMTIEYITTLLIFSLISTLWVVMCQNPKYELGVNVLSSCYVSRSGDSGGGGIAVVVVDVVGDRSLDQGSRKVAGEAYLDHLIRS